MSILDHISLAVSDYTKSKTFYEKALAPLGIAPLMEFGRACGFGKNGKPAPKEVLRAAPFGRVAFAHADLTGAMDHRNAFIESNRAVGQLLDQVLV